MISQLFGQRPQLISLVLNYHIFNGEIKDFLLIALSGQNRNTEGTHEMSVLIHNDIAAPNAFLKASTTPIFLLTPPWNTTGETIFLPLPTLFR